MMNESESSESIYLEMKKIIDEGEFEPGIILSFKHQ
jgi:hypothetical protein